MMDNSFKEEVEKKNIVAIIFTIILSILLLIGGFIIYDKIFNKNLETDKVEQKKEIEDTEDEALIKSTIESIVETELYILNNRDKFEKITNQDRLLLALNLYCEEKGFNIFGFDAKGEIVGEIKASDLEKAYSNSSLSNILLDHETILIADEPYWIYNDENKVYETDKGGHGINWIDVVSKDIIEFAEDDNKYTIAYNYIWSRSRGDGPSDLYLYVSYKEALENGKNIFSVPYDFEYLENTSEKEYRDYFKNAVNEYLETEYDNIKDSLVTYNYVFEKQNDKIILIDFYTN